MSYDDDERSITQNRPIELFTIATPTKTYNLTSHNVNVDYAGSTFTATTMGRTKQEVAQDLGGRALSIVLPITHPLVQRFAAGGLPEHQVLVTLQRLQAVSGVAVHLWSGFATGMSVDDHTATLQVPSVTDDAMKIRLPVVRAQRLCNHVLFDPLCAPFPGPDGPDRASFTVSTAIASMSGTTLVVTSMDGKPDLWAQFGEIVEPITAQRRLVLDHSGTTLTLNASFIDVAVGTSVAVSAGCPHDIFGCLNKFNNVTNFGGHPDINSTVRPFVVGGRGTIIQV